jgi:hypothetical protein
MELRFSPQAAFIPREPADMLIVPESFQFRQKVHRGNTAGFIGPVFLPSVSVILLILYHTTITA